MSYLTQSVSCITIIISGQTFRVILLVVRYFAENQTKQKNRFQCCIYDLENHNWEAPKMVSEVMSLLTTQVAKLTTNWFLMLYLYEVCSFNVCFLNFPPVRFFHTVRNHIYVQRYVDHVLFKHAQSYWKQFSPTKHCSWVHCHVNYTSGPRMFYPVVNFSSHFRNNWIIQQRTHGEVK